MSVAQVCSDNEVSAIAPDEPGDSKDLIETMASTTKLDTLRDLLSESTNDNLDIERLRSTPVTLVVKAVVIGTAFVAITILAGFIYLSAEHSVSTSDNHADIYGVRYDIKNIKKRIDVVETKWGSLKLLDNAGKSEIERVDHRLQSEDAAIRSLAEQMRNSEAERAAQYMGVLARLEKLEERPALPTVTLASLGSENLITDVTVYPKTESKEPNQTAQLMRNFAVRRVRDGVATISSPAGWASFAIGDEIPRAGRVVSIGGHDGDWKVVTTLGTIGSPRRSR